MDEALQNIFILQAAFMKAGQWYVSPAAKEKL